jgi:glucokinase
MPSTIGLDIGGTKILGVVLDDDGKVVEELKHASPATSLDELVSAAGAIVHELGAALDVPAGARLVGVGAAGLVDDAGRVMYAPNLPGLREASLRTALEVETGCRVIVDNDANVATLGEATYGAAAGSRDVLMVTLGTGIGGGILFGGRVYRGAHGFGAEIGHFTVDRNGPICACGARGHWEAIASGNALGRLARELVESGGGVHIAAMAAGDAGGVTGEHVGRCAAAGDDAAIGLLARYADNVAIGLAGLANILDPERIVIAGGLVELGPLLFDPLSAAFLTHLEGAAYRPAVPIVAALLGERAGAVGAAVLARQLAP